MYPTWCRLRIFPGYLRFCRRYEVTKYNTARLANMVAAMRVLLLLMALARCRSFLVVPAPLAPGTTSECKPSFSICHVCACKHASRHVSSLAACRIHQLTCGSSQRLVSTSGSGCLHRLLISVRGCALCFCVFVLLLVALQHADARSDAEKETCTAPSLPTP